MSTTMNRVAIVLSEVDEKHLRALLERTHVWLTESPANNASARAVWDGRADKPIAGALTTFTPAGSSVDDWLRAVLEDVDAHHGESSQHGSWVSLEIIGAPISDSLRDFLEQLGASAFEPFEQGNGRQPSTRVTDTEAATVGARRAPQAL